MNQGLYERALELAHKLVKSNLVELDDDQYSVFDVAETLLKMQFEREEKIEFTDKQISYFDEIVEIEDMGELETIDISVTGDNLFYCNNILTKNSFGIPAIADFFAAIINTDELKQLNQLMFKQLKNRYTGISTDEKFLMGVDYLKMKLYELDNSSPPIPETSKPLNKQSGKKTSDASPKFDMSLLQKSSTTNDSFDGFNF